MTERPTSKSTKTEILQAYEDLLQEKEQLAAKVEQVIKEKQAAGTEGGKIIAKERIAERSAVPSTIDGIIATLSGLRTGFGDAVSELSAKLIAEASQLAELRRNVEEEMEQLEVLHGLQVTDGTLDQLIQEYVEKSNSFEVEAKQRQEAFEQEMAEKRKVWQKEQEEHARFIKERDETTKKAEQREAAEYTYNLELRRKLDDDAYEQQQAQLKKALEDFEETKKKEWTEREKRVAEQEKEFKTLQAQVEKFPKELEIAVKKAKEEGTAMARRQTKVKADLRAKEVEGERRVYELKVQSLEDIIKKQQQQLNSLSAQLDAAVKQVQELAVKAIEGASSTGSLQAVKEIALEQAKNVQKGK
jgi:hypothetical protein